MNYVRCGRPSMEGFTFKSSSAEPKTLLIGDSQVRQLQFANVNILQLPVAGVQDAYRFVPQAGIYDTIVLFIGGNDLYKGYHPSQASVDEVPNSIIDLAESLYNVPNRVFVIGITPQIPPEPKLKALKEYIDDHEINRNAEVNRKLENRAEFERWGYRGLAERSFSFVHIAEIDSVHLNDYGLSQIRIKLKDKILYKRFAKELAWKEHPRTFDRTRQTGCLCGSFPGSIDQHRIKISCLSLRSL